MTNSVDSDSAAQQRLVAHQANELFAAMSPQERIAWSLENSEGEFILSSSFGIQSAVLLHMLTEQKPDISIVLLDTGYLFPETYRFIDELTERLTLNVKRYSSLLSPAWQEARYGELWHQGVEGIKRYNQMNKVEPMARALDELNVGTWFSGLRRQQSSTRENKPFVELSQGTVKVYPILDWTNKDVHYYLKDNDLPYHPLWDQGYVSVGDSHTSQPLKPGMTEEETRFFGLTRECGLHGDGI